MKKRNSYGEMMLLLTEYRNEYDKDSDLAVHNTAVDIT